MSIKTIIQNCAKTNDVKKVIRKYMEPYISIYPTAWPLYKQAYHQIYLKQSIHPVLCPVCGSELKFAGLKKGYPKNCSYKCRANNNDTQTKYKETCLERYGKEYASQTSDFRNQVEQTCLHKFGVSNPAKSPSVQEKYQQTVLAKYGVTNASKAQCVKDKIRNSHINTGNWKSYNELSKLDQYRREVEIITKRSYHDHYYDINPNDLERSRYVYHLDHIYSVQEGFNNNVPPEVIGHWTNLRMMWHLDN